MIINASKKNALIGNEHIFRENEPGNAILTPDMFPPGGEVVASLGLVGRGW